MDLFGFGLYLIIFIFIDLLAALTLKLSNKFFKVQDNRYLRALKVVSIPLFLQVVIWSRGLSLTTSLLDYVLYFLVFLFFLWMVQKEYALKWKESLLVALVTRIITGILLTLVAFVIIALAFSLAFSFL